MVFLLLHSLCVKLGRAYCRFFFWQVVLSSCKVTSAQNNKSKCSFSQNTFYSSAALSDSRLEIRPLSFSKWSFICFYIMLHLFREALTNCCYSRIASDSLVHASGAFATATLNLIATCTMLRPLPLHTNWQHCFSWSRQNNTFFVVVGVFFFLLFVVTLAATLPRNSGQLCLQAFCVPCLAVLD